jgi:hypothetical protein
VKSTNETNETKGQPMRETISYVCGSTVYRIVKINAGQGKVLAEFADCGDAQMFAAWCGIQRGQRVLLIRVNDPPHHVSLNYDLLAEFRDGKQVLDETPTAKEQRSKMAKAATEIAQLLPGKSVIAGCTNVSTIICGIVAESPHKQFKVSKNDADETTITRVV